MQRHTARRAIIPLLLLLMLLLLLQLPAASTSKKLQLNSQQQLEHLLIKVEDKFVTPDLVKAIRDTLEVFSSKFADATAAVGRRIRLASATLLVSHAKAQELRAAGHTVHAATWEMQQEEDIYLREVGKSGAADDGSKFDNDVVQPSGCGVQGRRILMMVDTFENSSRVGSSLNAQVLLQLFSRYRYGLYSEQPHSDHFYLDRSERYQPIVCSAALPGKLFVGRNPGQDFSSELFAEKCITWDRETGTPQVSGDCTFRLQTGGGGEYASLLYSTSSALIGRFCDTGDGVSERLRHNSEAPTDQNRVCDSSSAAEVMRRHPDFQGADAGSEVEPQLLLVERDAARRIVLVLDTSGSMGSEYRILNLKVAASRYVRYFVEAGASVAVLEFSGSTTVMHNFTKLDSWETREMLARSIQSLTTGGSTNICGGMLTAMRMLSGTDGPSFTKAATGFVVLFTDGQHNVNSDCTKLEDTLGWIQNASIVFDTITLSTAADATMSAIAEASGGKSFFSPSTSSVTTELDTAFASLADRSPLRNQTKLLTVEKFTLPLPQPILVEVGDSVTHTLHIMVSIPGGSVSSISVTVTHPNGTEFGPDSGPDIYEISTALSSVVVKIPDSEIAPGNWTINIVGTTSRRRREAAGAVVRPRSKRSTSGDSGSVVVVGGSGGNSSESTLELDAFLRYSEIDELRVDTVQTVYVTILKGGLKLRGATVRAKVTWGSGDELLLDMKDNGMGADILADDGTYSCLVRPDQLPVAGEYSLTVQLVSPDSRTVSAGQFRVNSVPATAPKLPPSRISDLTVLINVRLQLLHLRFTAVGDQADSGTPGSFEIRAAQTHLQLSSDFANASLLLSATGQPAGTAILLTVSATNISQAGLSPNSTFYLAAAAVSQAGLRGQSSFPVSATLSFPHYEISTTGPSDVAEQLWLTQYWWVVLPGVLIVVLVVAISVALAVNGRRKTLSSN